MLKCDRWRINRTRNYGTAYFCMRQNNEKRRYSIIFEKSTMLLSEEKMRYLQYIQILKIRILPSFNVFLLSSWVKRNYRIVFSISSNIKSNWPTVYRTRIDKCKISIIRYREWFPTCWRSKRDEKRMERADASFQDQNLVWRDKLLQFLYICRVNKNVLRWI